MTDLPPVYALRVTHEQKAIRQLHEANLTCWSPTFAKLRPAVNGQRARSVDVPLFPGYVFARLADAGEFEQALGMPDVFGVLRIGERPAPIPEAEWVRVLMMVMSGRFDEQAPAKKAQPRGHRRRALAAMQEWFKAATRST